MNSAKINMRKDTPAPSPTLCCAAQRHAAEFRKMLKVIVTAALLLGAHPPLVSSAPGQENGRFIGEVIVQWLEDGRLMRLREPFGYLAKDGQSWNVPKDTIVDGATIPSLFWSFTGGPFSGRYRAASVIHDYYCATRIRPWRDVHLVFYEAMLTAGVQKGRARLLYNAVLNFGPTWDPPKPDPSCVRSDGTIDFENCSTNSLTVSPIKYPKYDKKDVSAFLDSMRGRVAPEDLEAVSKELAKQP